MTHKSRWRLRDVLSVTAVLLSGFIIAGILAYLATESENDLSSQAFAGTFQSQIPAFETFFDIRVLALRAIADSLSLYGLAINRSVSQPIMRSYVTILAPIYGGVAILQRVSNDYASIAAWEAKASAAWGLNVSVYNAGFNASVGQPYIWVVSDGGASTVRSSQTGRDLTSRSNIRAAVDIMTNDINSGSESVIASDILVPTSGSDVVITDLFYFPAVQLYGFELLTTVWPGDTSELVLVSGVINAYVNPILALSSGAIITVTDHTGFAYSRGDCDANDAVSELTGSVSITTNATWSVVIGECPAYRARFATWKRYVFPSIMVLATVLAVEVYRRMLRKSWDEADKEHTAAQQQVYSMIVGYVCHEVRNPLHVLKSSFEGLADVVGRTGDSSGEGDMIADGTQAIAQMQSTVNDVLDLHAMTAGEFSLNRSPVIVYSSLLSVLKRCRSYLPQDVAFQYCLPLPQLCLQLDMRRLSQIITNAVSNAGKFVSAGGLVDVDVRVVAQIDTPPSESCYLLITVSNSRAGPSRLEDVDRLFVPFGATVKTASSQGKGSFWKGSLAPQSHVDAMASLWHHHRPSLTTVFHRLDRDRVAYAGPGEVVGEIPSNAQYSGSRVTTSTGLGLPLCRSLAVAGGGWVGLEDMEPDTSLPHTFSFTRSTSPFISSTEVSSPVPHTLGLTQFWCAIKATVGTPPLSPADQPNEVIAGTAGESKHDHDENGLGEEVLGTEQRSGCVGQLPCSEMVSSSPQPDNAAPLPAVDAQRQCSRSSTPALPPVVEVPQSAASDQAVVVTILEEAKESSAVSSGCPSALNQSPVLPVDGSLFSSLRCVFIDDEAPNRRIGSRYLAQLKVPSPQITLLCDGPSALSYLSDPGNKAGVDVVFLDIMMPGLSGIQVMEQLRERPEGCVVIACTGSVEASTIAELRRVGFDGCLAKPFTKSGMESAIRLALSRAGWFLQVER